MFTSYLAYRHGRKKAERRAEAVEARNARTRREAQEEVCNNCGYRLEQHSDDEPPQCPNY